MVASLKFYTDSGRSTEATAADLSDAKVVVYEDGNGNKYTLDASSIANLNKIDDIKLSTLKDVVFKYQLKGDNSETTSTGLGSIIGSLFATQSVQNGKTILAEEVAKKPVVDVLVPALATVGTDDTKKVYTKTEAGSTFLKTADLATKVAEKPVVDAITASADFTGNVYTKPAADAAFVKATDLATKAAEKDVVDSITASPDFTNKVYVKATPADEVYTKTAADTTFLKTSDLATKVAEQAVVDVLVPALATVGTDDTKKVYTKGIADTNFAKINASNLTDAANQKAFAEAILPAKDGQKSILVEKLGVLLDSTDSPYGASQNQAAKAFLAEKGLKPTPQEVATELMKNPNFTQLAAIEANVNDEGFQSAVKGVMSQPSFEIPTDPNTPLSWDF